jgi:hypothetical protein
MAKKNPCSFHYSFSEKAHSRRDQRYISTRSTSRSSGVDQGCLNESTFFAIKSTTPWRIKLMFYNGSFRKTILACLQVTRNPSDKQHQIPISHIQATYAMAATREPSDSKGSPVDSILPAWIRVGYENRLNTVIPFYTIITYSTMAATNSLQVVSKKRVKRRVNKSDNTLVDELYFVRLCFNIY